MKVYGNKYFSVAPAYLANHFEPWLIPMFKNVLAHLAISEKQILLDAGCGSGLFSSLAIAAGIQVIAIDSDPAMIEIARKRNPLNNFMLENPASLPFADNSFHVVVSLNCFQDMENIQEVLAEARRVLRPGGSLVISIWDKPEWCESYVVFRALNSTFEKNLFNIETFYPDSKKVEDEIARSGLKLKFKTSVECPFLFDSIADGVKGFMGTEPAAWAILEESENIVRNKIEKALNVFRITDGFYFMRNRMMVFMAEK